MCTIPRKSKEHEFRVNSRSRLRPFHALDVKFHMTLTTQESVSKVKELNKAQVLTVEHTLAPGHPFASGLGRRLPLHRLPHLLHSLDNLIR